MWSCIARGRHPTNSERWIKRYWVALQNFAELHYIPPTTSVSIFGELKVCFPLCSSILCWIQMGVFLPVPSRWKHKNGTPARNESEKKHDVFWMENICFISLSYLWVVMSAFLCTTLKWQILGAFKTKTKEEAVCCCSHTIPQYCGTWLKPQTNDLFHNVSF